MAEIRRMWRPSDGLDQTSHERCLLATSGPEPGRREAAGQRPRSVDFMLTCRRGLDFGVVD